MIRKSGYIWRAFGKVNLRLVELVGVGSETSYYWFNWSSAKRLDPQRISFLFLFLNTLQLQFSIFIQWFMICFHYKNNAIIFFIESIYLRIFLIITLHHLIHTFTMIFLHIRAVQVSMPSSKGHTIKYIYILDLPVSPRISMAISFCMMLWLWWNFDHLVSSKLF